MSEMPKVGDRAPGARAIYRYNRCIVCGEIYIGHHNSLYCNSGDCQRERTKKTNKNGRLKYFDKRPGKPFTASQWEELCRQFGNRCLCCGRDDIELTIDHIIPISKGGRHELGNVQPLCRPCNSKKSNRRMTDYRPDTVNRLLEKWLRGEIKLD